MITDLIDVFVFVLVWLHNDPMSVCRPPNLKEPYVSLLPLAPHIGMAAFIKTSFSQVAMISMRIFCHLMF